MYNEKPNAGAEVVFLEYEHGDIVLKCQLYLFGSRPIITLEVSRLARSTKQLCEIIEVIRAKRLRLDIVGSITVDCSNGEIDPMTNAKAKGAKIGSLFVTLMELFSAKAPSLYPEKRA